MNILPTLEAIVNDPVLHPRWLNSLSYLEYRGFRKIARSQGSGDMTLEMLTHTMEEVRHALFFKRQAVRLHGDAFRTYTGENMLCASAIKKYFYDLDRGVVERLGVDLEIKVAQAAYCLITWLIEERAMLIYRHYDRLLKSRALGFTLTAILLEESHHLAEMAEGARTLIAASGISAITLQEMELQAFNTLWTEIEHYVNTTLTVTVEHAL